MAPVLRALVWLVLSVLLVIGCTETSNATPSEPAASGLTVVDPRLMPVMIEIAGHPEWAPGSTADMNAHLALPSLEDLCVEVSRPDLLPLHVTVDVESAPWTVKSIVILDPASDGSPEVTYDKGDDPDTQPDLCLSVLAGSGAPFPTDLTSIEVGGGIQDPTHGPVIAQAIVQDPRAFGLDRSSRPAINLFPLASTTENQACYEAVVFQGGPRADVTITLLNDDQGWHLANVRIGRQALHTPGPTPDGAC